MANSNQQGFPGSQAVNKNYKAGLFKEVAQPPGFAHGNKNAAKLLEPAGEPVIDVVRGYRWTAGDYPTEFVLNETPFIHLREFRYLRTGAELLAVAMLTNNTVNATTNTNPYANLYNYDDPTKFEYILPFFTTDYYDVSNSFRESNAESMGDAMKSAGSGMLDSASSLKTFGGAAGALGGVADAARGVIGVVSNVASMVNSGAGAVNQLRSVAGGDGKLDVPQVWDNTSPRSITFSFYLFNTYDVSDIKQNWEFVHLLRYQNVMNKLTMVNAIPPVFYEVRIPGVHYSLASYIQSLKIENVGSSHCFMSSDIGLPGGQIHIPDAFKITITLMDFLKPSQNMLEYLVSGNTDVARSQSSQASNVVKAAKGVTRGGNDLLNAVSHPIDSIGKLTGLY